MSIPYEEAITAFFKKHRAVDHGVADLQRMIEDLKANRYPDLPPYECPLDFFLFLLRSKGHYRWHIHAAVALQAIVIRGSNSQEAYEELCRHSEDALSFDADIMSDTIKALSKSKEGRAFLEKKAIHWMTMGLDEWAQEAVNLARREK
jgi:hypothetical protein